MKLTPMLEQYLRAKQEHPDALLFFRLGDFYEMFFEDAERAARMLDVTLTTRSKKDEVPIPMCGVPYHSVQPYIAKLLAAGFKVAICDQMEDPSTAQGAGVARAWCASSRRERSPRRNASIRSSRTISSRVHAVRRASGCWSRPTCPPASCGAPARPTRRRSPRAELGWRRARSCSSPATRRSPPRCDAPFRTAC